MKQELRELKSGEGVMTAMDVRAIPNEADYDWALSEIEQYFEHEPRRGTKQAARFDVLAR
jgi:antitoxin component HigA of HigAB toxin-antitoxin module